MMHVILFISLLLLLLFLAIDVLLAEERDRVAQADDSQVRDCGRGQAQVGVRGCDLEQRKEHDHHGQVQQAHGALRRRVAAVIARAVMKTFFTASTWKRCIRS